MGMSGWFTSPLFGEEGWPGPGKVVAWSVPANTAVAPHTIDLRPGPRLRTVRTVEYVDFTVPAGTVVEAVNVASYELCRRTRQAVAVRIAGDPRGAWDGRFMDLRNVEEMVG